MSEMVERVARAIHDAGFPENLRDETWNDRRWKECAMGQALAALRAMREPTREMINHPSYVNGEWSRRNIESFFDAAINEGK